MIKKKNLLYNSDNEETHIKLNYDNLIITGLSEINFNTAYEYETDYDGDYINTEIINTFKETWLAPEASNKGAFSDDNGVYNKNAWIDAMYENAMETGIWQYISSIEVTVDTKDQWGKYASDRVSEAGKLNGVTTNPQITPGIDPSNPNKEETQINETDATEENPYDDLQTYQIPNERKVTFVVINPELDIDMDSRIIENIRYINENYLETLKDTDWANKNSINKLLRMFALQKMQNSPTWVDCIEPIKMSYITAIGSTVTVDVYDYGIYTETEEAWQNFLSTNGLTEPAGYERR